MARGTEGGWRGRLPVPGPRGSVLLLALLLLLLAVPAPPAEAQLRVDIDLRDTLVFDPARIDAEPGENVTVFLRNVGSDDHTFTLFPTREPTDLISAIEARDNTGVQRYYQQNEPILDVFLAGGEEVETNFTAPMEAGEYFYVCMVPGHAISGMWGILRVGLEGGGDFQLPIGLVQGLMLIALVGTVVFAFVYHIKTTRR